MYSVSWYARHPLEFFRDILSEIKWAWQRVFRGWDDRVVWSIDAHLAKYMPQWIERLKEHPGVPVNSITDFTSDEEFEMLLIKWHKELDVIIDGFRAADRIINRSYDYRSVTYKALKEEDYQKVIKGLEKFKDYYFDLWY